ncbi:MAG: rhodanese-like domain-containing protein [Phycisphaerales bacterium]
MATLVGGCGSEITDADIVDISITKVKSLVDDPKGGLVLIDARAPQDFATGHIPGARNMPLSSFTGRPGDLDPSIANGKTIVVYGENPGSPVARGTTKRMLASGYEDVFFFGGGISEWKRGGYEVRTK